MTRLPLIAAAAAIALSAVPAFADNYLWLIHDADSGDTAVVDPGDPAPVLAEADRRGWKINKILNTHWHGDHTGGNLSIKEATGSVERVSDLRRRLPESFTILSGDDSLTLPFMAVGAVGVVSVASNLFPSQVCELVSGCESGDLKSAAKLHRKLLPLFKDLFIEPNPVPVKTALGWRGAISDEVRLPLCEMSEANQARLRKTLEEFEQEK